MSHTEDSAKPNRKTKRVLWIVLAVILPLAGWIWWQIYRSYHDVQLSEQIWQTDKVSEPIDILMMSDLHDHQFGNNNEELTDLAASSDPDLILLNGDMINDDTNSIDELIDLVRQLSKTAPVYLSMGNQEYENPKWSEFQKRLDEEGIEILDADFRDLKINGQNIRLGGLYDYSFALNGYDSVEESRMDPKTVSFLHEFQDTDALKIIMTHRPDTFLFNQSPDYWDVDLALCGHTHGGQIVLPFGGGLWAPDQGWFPEYVKGVTHNGNLTLITSSGLSSGHEKLPRFNNPPEILMVRIVAES